MSYPTNYELLLRIKDKLDRHDKSLFTALELNLLRNLVENQL